MKKLIAMILIAMSIMTVTSCNKKSTKLFESVMSADEALAEAKKTDTVVFEFEGVTSGKDVWDSFCEKTSKGDKASVLCAHYYTLDDQNISEELYEEEEDDYPVLYFYLIEFDGQEYRLRTRDSKSEATDTDETFKYLLHFTGDGPATALYEKYDHYILADDDTLTMEQIDRSMFSSQLDDHIRHRFVYSDFSGWKDA